LSRNNTIFFKFSSPDHSGNFIARPREYFILFAVYATMLSVSETVCHHIIWKWVWKEAVMTEDNHEELGIG
jgi:hypothetical protein